MNNNRQNEHCLFCGSAMSGRSDKKFCDPHCKSAYQYQQEKENPRRFYNIVDTQLRQNRRILKAFNKAGKATVRAELLLQQGFNPNFFTHYWKNSKDEVYLFVYEFGFIKRHENGRQKYVLIHWQEYMSVGFREI